MSSGNCSNHHMSCMEYSLNYCKRSFNKRSGPSNRFISSFLFYWEGMSSRAPMHRLVHRCRWFYTKVALIPIYRLPLLWEINLTVMSRGGGCIQPSYKLMVFIHENVEFIPKEWSISLLCPRSISAPSRLCFLASWHIGRGMPRIGSDESRILKDSSFNLQTFSIKLVLKLIPDLLSFPASISRSLKYHVVVESGILSGNPRNFRNEIRSFARLSNSGSERP